MSHVRPTGGARIPRRLAIFLIAVTVGTALTGISLALSGAGGSGYGLDKSADRSHELAGVKAAAANLSDATHGQIVVDTSPASLVFSEENRTATTSVRVGHCTVGGMFRNVPFNTNNALSATDVGPLYIGTPNGRDVIIRTAGTGQLAAIKNSALAGCLSGATAKPTVSATS